MNTVTIDQRDFDGLCGNALCYLLDRCLTEIKELNFHDAEKCIKTANEIMDNLWSIHSPQHEKIPETREAISQIEDLFVAAKKRVSP
jgi:hypothetical protein